MRIPTRRRAGDIEVQMTAMIDVVFLLLIFFLSASAFAPLEYDLPSALASPVAEESASVSAAAAETPNADPLADHLDDLLITLRPGEAGQVIPWLHQRPVTPTQLMTQLHAVAQLGVQPAVILHPWDPITMGQAIEFFDAAKQAGLQDVRWAITDSDTAAD